MEVWTCLGCAGCSSPVWVQSFPVCSETERTALSHTSPYPSARPRVFLIHYFKDRNVARTKINTALSWIRVCVRVR